MREGRRAQAGMLSFRLRLRDGELLARPGRGDRECREGLAWQRHGEVGLPWRGSGSYHGCDSRHRLGVKGGGGKAGIVSARGFALLHLAKGAPPSCLLGIKCIRGYSIQFALAGVHRN